MYLNDIDLDKYIKTETFENRGNLLRTFDLYPKYDMDPVYDDVEYLWYGYFIRLFENGISLARYSEQQEESFVGFSEMLVPTGKVFPMWEDVADTLLECIRQYIIFNQEEYKDVLTIERIKNVAGVYCYDNEQSYTLEQLVGFIDKSMNNLDCEEIIDDRLENYRKKRMASKETIGRKFKFEKK